VRGVQRDAAEIGERELGTTIVDLFVAEQTL
jgi:hypothetical protein